MNKLYEEIKTMEQALERISKLELEVELLKDIIHNLEERKPVGRRKHDDKWTEKYNNFVAAYESGKSVNEIVQDGEISRRTAYRYKAYYDELMKNNYYIKVDSCK